LSTGPGPDVPVILLLSGPNLGLLGERQPEVYGRATLEDHRAAAATAAAAAGFALEHFRSDREGELVEAVHSARGRAAGIVINPGALTHYAWSLHDALAAFDGPIVELHLSNPARREPWRHVSVVSPVADAVIAGLGANGYPMAVRALAALLSRATG
jgi:3-dehydroquinate dehydratase-2